MITNGNKGTYLGKNGQKHDNVIYERPLVQIEKKKKDPAKLWKNSHSSEAFENNIKDE